MDEIEDKREESIRESIRENTKAIKELTDKIAIFMTMYQKAIPYPMVLLMFAIIIAALFGVKSLGAFVNGALASQ